MKIVILIGVVLLISGCDDHGRCLTAHTETVLQPMLIGKVIILMPQIHDVCDRWEFPHGKPKH